ncbi:MAG TPA: MOSC N-terminal beta barrel domain-containing protein [Stellaceae bacterium]|nr:MOSC N-terminal beta barrel domain-containing protein [Stellaceae bacterium]
MPSVLPIGRVVELWRYPVKSMRGHSLETAVLGWTGIAGDRQYGFVRRMDRSRFPWLTGRTAPRVLLYEPSFAMPDDPRNSALRVTAPDGIVHDIWDNDLTSRLSEEAGEPVIPLQVGRGMFDQHPVSVISTDSFARLDAAFGAKLDRRRFRINIVIEPEGGSLIEAEWAGRSLAFGEADAPPTLRIDAPISRCSMVTVDPVSAARDASVMRVVAQDFDNRVGHYGAPTTRGVIAVGDRVYLRR